MTVMTTTVTLSSHSCSDTSDSLWLQALKPARFLCPWNAPAKNTGVGCQALLQGIFPTHGSNLGLLHFRQILYHLSHQRSPKVKVLVAQSCPTLQPMDIKAAGKTLYLSVCVCVCDLILTIFFFIIILFLNFTILYWFCHISTWIHHRYTRVSHPEPSSLLPPPSLYHPSGSFQCTSPKPPVSCIEPGLATCFIYDIIHVSMPFNILMRKSLPVIFM